MGVVCLLSYFFYRSFVAIVFLSPLLYFYIRKKEESSYNKTIYQLNLQFKDAITAVNIALQAGYSLENAFLESYKEMILLYGSDSIIAKEWYLIQKGLKNNITLESLLKKFTEHYNEPDINDFVEVICIAKRSGGNMVDIIDNTVKIIESKMQVKAEVELVISGKKLEQRIMNVIPFFIIFYLDITSKGFFDVLYGNMIGIIIMTICLGIYMAAYLMSEKITDIKVM
ncbi:MAG: hypothetical protein R3Y24_06215 [Eubacteriales bacterium]